MNELEKELRFIVSDIPSVYEDIRELLKRAYNLGATNAHEKLLKDLRLTDPPLMCLEE